MKDAGKYVKNTANKRMVFSTSCMWLPIDLICHVDSRVYKELNGRASKIFKALNNLSGILYVCGIDSIKNIHCKGSTFGRKK